MLKQSKSHFYLFVLVLCSIASELSAQDHFRYSTSEADTILIEFNREIQKYHPFAFRGNGKARLDSILLIVRAKLPSLIEDDSIHVADLIALTSTYNNLIGDGHLQLTRKRDEDYSKQNKLYNYEFYTRYVEDGRIILSDTLTLLDSSKFYPGTEVLTFQGEEVKKIYARLGAFIGLNDHNYASAKTYFPSLNPASFYQRLYGWKDSLQVTLKTEEETQSVTLFPSTLIAYLNRDTSIAIPKVEALKRTRKVKKQEAVDRLNRLVRLDTTSHPDVYKLKIRTFSSSAFERVNEYSHLKNLMKRLDSLNAKGLIIDLRNNTGGSLDFVNHAYSMIATDNFYSGDAGFGYSQRARGKSFSNRFFNTVFGGIRKEGSIYTKKSMREKSKPKKGKAHFSGEVAVLVNETTFSGGTCFANYVQTYKRGKVVGQISGGSAERMFAGTLFKQPIGPDKTLLINMPLWYMDMPGDNIGNITPDIIVPRTAEVIMDQRDETLAAAVKSFSFVE